MKKIVIAVCLVFGLTLLSSCTSNIRTRVWGGTTTQNIPKGQKFINATWKESNLWVLTRPMHENENAERYEFIESSAFGTFEGKVIFIESK
jgi:hypothetical protein